MRTDRGRSLRQFVEHCLGLLQVQGVKALAEPAVDRNEKLSGFVSLSLIAPQPCHAHRGTELPGLCPLLARHYERALKKGFRFHRIWFRSNSAISRAVRLISASHHVSLLSSTNASAWPIQLQLSSNLPTYAQLYAQNDKNNGVHTVAPIERHAAIPDVIT
jgi:hypothetical protein